MTVFGWLNDQVLRMVWLNDLVGQGVVAIGLDPASPIGGSVQFFVYDVIKIFLLLSVLFYAHHLVPPHILARENMAFGPFGMIFRRAGAFFMRKNLDDPLYKEVFRAYVE